MHFFARGRGKGEGGRKDNGTYSFTLLASIEFCFDLVFGWNHGWLAFEYFMSIRRMKECMEWSNYTLTLIDRLFKFYSIYT